MGDRLSGIDTLTPRQREILRLIAKHLQAKEVAQILKISERTVKTHTDAARKRLGVATSREAARILVEHENQLALKERPEAAPTDAIVPEAIVLEGRWPSRTIDSPPDALSASGHERSIYPETTILSGPLERAGGSLAHAGGPVETGPDRRDAERRAIAEQAQQFRQGNFLGDRSDGLADRRRAEFERQLRAINTPQWLGLIALVAVASALLMSGLITSALGTLQAIEKLNLHAG